MKFPNHASIRSTGLLGSLVAVLLLTVGARADLEQPASWSPPGAPDVRDAVIALLDERSVDAETRAQVEQLWADPPDDAEQEPLLARLAATCALIEPAAGELIEFCDHVSEVVVLPEFAILRDPQQPALISSNLRLLYGRWLTQHEFYDEAIDQLEALDPQHVVDPAALLFYLSASYHRMPDKQKCLPTIDRLLENESLISRRYATVARLMRADLEPLKPDSLDEIARLMDEMRRRLNLRRAGTRVREQGEEIVAKLDKLIEQIEEQQQQAAAGAASLQSSSPAQDSTPMGGKGPGNVDPKQLGTQSGWGNLPPQERQEALQQIGKDLPAHYREVIEEYFRKLAREEN
jgi:hypothetical protein